MITEVGRILEMTHKAGLSHEKIQERRIKEDKLMRDRLQSLIMKYEKKVRMDELSCNREYYLGKIDAYKVALELLTEEGN